MNAIAPLRPWGTSDKIKLGILGLMFSLIMGSPHVGGYFADVSLSTDVTAKLTDSPPSVLAAFPGAQGYGTETVHGRGGAVIQVTNLNDSGAGSLRACMQGTGARNCIFRVSGTITLNSSIKVEAANNNLAVYGQTAPGDGIAIKASGDIILVRLGRFSGGSSPATDVLIQHIRFRHGVPQVDDGRASDDLDVFQNSSNIVIDHNSFTWTADEAITMWGNNIHDITFSHNIVGEGVIKESSGGSGPLFQNTGPLISGGSPHYRVSFHHNLFLLGWYRFPRLSTDNAGNPGWELINNVHYEQTLQNMSFDESIYQNFNFAMNVDVIGNYFKDGPSPVRTVRPYTLLKQGIGSVVPASFHFVGSTYRNSDGTPHNINDEANNYSMLSVQSQFAGGTPSWASRGTRMTPQPQNPIPVTSFAQAYTDVVTNEDVGAQPLDSVDQRLVDAPDNGDSWSSVNIPSPHGSGSFPTLTTGTVPTDTDNDGVPDSYETSPLGSNPNVSDSQLDHNSDGYTNLEDWVHSISGAGA